MAYRRNVRRIEPLEALFDAAEGITPVARFLGLSAGTVSGWHGVPPEFVLRLEEKFGVSRHTLRPDVFGPAPEASAA